MFPLLGDDISDAEEVVDRIDEPTEESKRRRVGSRTSAEFDEDVATTEEQGAKRQRPGGLNVTWADEADDEDNRLGLDRDYRRF